MAPEVQERNRYVGPRPFEPQDRDLFFGRDRETSEVLSLIIAHRVLLLYAQSGAGKTSLINAGLIPLLKEEGFEILPRALVSGPIPETIEPEEIPNLYVFNTLMSWVEDEADPGQLAKMSLVGFLREREHLTDEEGLPSARVVIFDQFEELFTFYPKRRRDREQFFEQVRRALEEDPLLRVVFVIREDYIAQLDPYAPLLPEKLRTRFRLERLREEAALSAVTGPLADVKRSFAKGVAEQLVKELLKVRVETAPGKTEVVTGEFVEPVQLQVVCQNLPRDITVITQDHLQAFGDVNQALSGFYERSIKRAAQEPDVKEGDLRSWFERNLITLAGTRGTVYRGREKTGGIPNTAVDVLENLHLIRGERRAGAQWYELTHDRFIEPILASNEEWRKTHKTLLTDAAREWERLGKCEGSLLRGARLDEAVEWAQAHPTDLDELERDFLKASLALREREAAEKEKQRQRELEAARKLAKEQRQRAEAERKRAEEQRRRAEAERQRAKEQAQAAASLRKRAIGLGVVGLGAILLAIIAGVFAWRSNQNEQRAIYALTQVEVALDAAKDEINTGKEARATLGAVLEANLIAQASAAEATPESPTDTPIPSPTATSTGTLTPPPETTPTATPTASPTPTPNQTVEFLATELAKVRATQTLVAKVESCVEPQGDLRSFWNKHKWRLGCPIQTDPVGGYFAEQRFENGYMLWSPPKENLPEELFVVTIGNDTGTWHQFRGEDFLEFDCPDEGVSCPLDTPPPPDRFQPERGFGCIWCAGKDIQESIGLGIEKERAVSSGNLLQEFEHGIILRDSQSWVYILFEDDGRYIRERP